MPAPGFVGNEGKNSEDVGKILEKIGVKLGVVMAETELLTLKQFFSLADVFGVGALSPANIQLLISSFDRHLLSEKGLFVFLDKFQNFSRVDDKDEMRIVGLLADRKWIVIKIYPLNVIRILKDEKDRDIELRDCFNILRFGERLNKRDFQEILFSLDDIKKIVVAFYAEINSIASNLEKKLRNLRKCEQELQKILSTLPVKL